MEWKNHAAILISTSMADEDNPDVPITRRNLSASISLKVRITSDFWASNDKNWAIFISSNFSYSILEATFHKACGHLKAVAYYVESISDKCKLRACECTYQKFLASKCSPNKCVFWGYNATKGSTGMYYGVTATAYPYCRTNGSE
jgi:hypothetical protein